jgi:uncharacterized protein
MKFLPHALLIVLIMPLQSYALDCPKIPEQTNKEWDVEVKAAVGKIGPVKGAELETRTKKAVLDLMGKLPQADKVYLEQMMYATYCSALRDDKTLSESEKAARVRAYNLEVRKTLFGTPEKKDAKQKGALPMDERMEARLRLSQMSLPYTSDAFVESVKKGDIDAVKLFLAAGMDPNTEDKDGVEVLRLAIWQSHRRIIDALLKAKASVNGTTKWGWGPVSDAATPGKKDILLVLLKHGPDIKSLNAAFLSAASYGDRDLMEMLIKRGADTKATVDNESIIDLALYEAVDSDRSSPEKDLNETVEFLLDLGTGVNTQFKKGDGKTTALLLAIQRGSETIVKTLIDRGADPNVRWDCNCIYKNFTPLMLVAWIAYSKSSYTTIVNTLLDKGADINAKCEPTGHPDLGGGSTALMIALIRGISEVAEILINRNADVSIKNDKGESAFLLSGAHIMKTLIDKGIDINQRDNNGNTALMKAAWRCSVDNVRILLDKGADVNIKNNVGETALMSAIAASCEDQKYIDLVRALLDKGADINARTKEGKTALMMAAEDGKIGIVKALLERGADPNEKDIYGRTALDFVQKSNLMDS